MRHKDLFLGTLLGAAAGFLAGLVFAPRTGRQTRDWLGEQARQSGKLIGRGGEFLVRRAEHEGARLRGILDQTRRKFSGAGKLYNTDDLINQRVKSELARNHKVRQVEGLLVDTFNGVVTVRGTVPNRSKLEDVLNVIYSVRGVRDIVNELRYEQLV
jgi:gas vesicle protein